MDNLSFIANKLHEKLRSLNTDTHGFYMANFSEKGATEPFLYSILYCSHADFEAFEKSTEFKPSLYRLATGTRMADITGSDSGRYCYELTLRTQEQDQQGIGFLIGMGPGDKAAEGAALYIFDFLVMGAYPTEKSNTLH